jgi:hypothetical protein|tara:strand:+ start:488 stop:964 length:477 start_codon:yes stop_codon:yes gene_type:complete
MDIYSIWAKSQNDSLNKAKEIINEIAEKEESIPFNPHVTLVTNMYSLEKAEEIFEKINKNKIIVNFDSFGVGNTYFQRLFLIASDNFPFFNAVSSIEVWPSLWTPHLSLFYGNELPLNFAIDEINNSLPIEGVFDTLELYTTGPDVSSWKEVTSIPLD